MKRIWRDYNLSIVLFILFILAWAAQTYSGWVRFAQEAASHGEAASFFGSNGYAYDWLEATFENWQSEFLQLLAFVILTASLIHKGSHESKDSDEKMQATLDKIERKFDELQGRLSH
ncbi:MAG TPA: DUF6766 family protein [Fimbriimonadales bacterium]|jgi:hypothetical protein|nr:DUF6766 family protein [Fimbriimonadales bacterium]